MNDWLNELKSDWYTFISFFNKVDMREGDFYSREQREVTTRDDFSIDYSLLGSQVKTLVFKYDEPNEHNKERFKYNKREFINSSREKIFAMGGDREPVYSKLVCFFDKDFLINFLNSFGDEQVGYVASLYLDNMEENLRFMRENIDFSEIKKLVEKSAQEHNEYIEECEDTGQKPVFMNDKTEPEILLEIFSNNSINANYIDRMLCCATKDDKYCNELKVIYEANNMMVVKASGEGFERNRVYLIEEYDNDIFISRLKKSTVFEKNSINRDELKEVMQFDRDFEGNMSKDTRYRISPETVIIKHDKKKLQKPLRDIKENIMEDMVFDFKREFPDEIEEKVSYSIYDYEKELVDILDIDEELVRSVADNVGDNWQRLSEKRREKVEAKIILRKLFEMTEFSYSDVLDKIEGRIRTNKINLQNYTEKIEVEGELYEIDQNLFTKTGSRYFFAEEDCEVSISIRSNLTENYTKKINLEEGFYEFKKVGINSMF